MKSTPKSEVTNLAGPWEAELTTPTNDGAIRIKADCYGDRVTVGWATNPRGYTTSGEDKNPFVEGIVAANARLMAASPDLLASINALMDQLQAARDNQPEAFAEFVNEVCDPAFKDACIAVARAVYKAEGPK